MRESFVYRSVVIVVSLFFILAPQAVRAQEPDVPESKEDSTPRERVSAADSAANYRQLQTNISTILGSPVFKKAKVGLSIYSLDQQRIVFERNAHQALTPASTTKLFFGYAAMRTLGADFAVPTQVVFDGTVSKDSVLNGNLYLVGHGDCLLTVSDIEALAERVRRAGIKEINGDIVADDTFFDELTDRQAYSGDKERMQALPPISALGVNRNLVTVLVSSSQSGVTRVQTVPQSDAFSVSLNNATSKEKTRLSAASLNSDESAAASLSKASRAEKEQLANTIKKKTPTLSSIKHTSTSSRKTSASSRSRTAQKVSTSKSLRAAKKATTRTRHAKTSGRARKHSDLLPGVHVEVDNDVVPMYPAYDAGGRYGDMKLRRAKAKRSGAAARPKITVRVSSIVQRDGHQEFIVSGAPPRSSTQSFSYEIRKPSLAAVGILYRSLSAEGLRLNGHIRNGQAAKETKVIAELKRPLTDFMSVVNKNSDNFVAEHIMKIVGAYCCGNQRCNVNAFSTLSSILDSAHIPLDGCALFDGSGLSRRNKTSASTQVHMLKNIAEQPFSSVFYNTMAIAGVDGTLHRRMIGTNAQNNVHAKTGTHNNVSALSGYVRTRDGERLCFSMISNGAGVGGFKQLENAVAIQLAEFSYKDGTIAVSSHR